MARLADARPQHRRDPLPTRQAQGMLAHNIVALDCAIFAAWRCRPIARSAAAAAARIRVERQPTGQAERREQRRGASPCGRSNAARTDSPHTALIAGPADGRCSAPLSFTHTGARDARVVG